MIENFFGNLSYLKRNENDLSDITWILCESSNLFRRLFLTFFFGEDKYDWNRVTDFQREYLRHGSRPDFYFKNEKQEYIVEVKINDRKQHFKQYNNKKTFANAEKAYITNYKVSAQELYVLKMWEDLVEYFKDFIKNTEKNKKNKEEKYELAFIEGYVKYVEAVCNIIKIENMNLSGITSLFNFINAVDKVIELEDNKLNCTRYTNTNKSYDHRQGRCFELQFVDGKLKDTWGWFGIYFNNQTVVCIEFNKEEGWGLPVYEKLQAKRKFTEGEYFAEPYEEDSAFYFELKKDVLEEFDELEDAEEQVEILNSFFKEVLEYIRK